MPVYGMIVTLSDAELSAEQSERVRPTLDRVFGSEATVAVWTSGDYHYWRVIHTIQAPKMLDAVEASMRLAAEARDLAGLDGSQAVGLSLLFRDLSHPVELALPPENSAPQSG
jgi:hypothetical protein